MALRNSGFGPPPCWIFMGTSTCGGATTAGQYLNTGLGDAAAEQRAEQLFVVLDALPKHHRPPPSVRQRSMH